VIQTAEPGVGFGDDPQTMDRAIAVALFVIAMLCFGGTVLLLLNGFVEYLQTDRWESLSLLQLGYDTHVLRARWFLANDWSWWIHDVLEKIPAYAALMAGAPLAWWLSGVIGER